MGTDNVESNDIVRPIGLKPSHRLTSLFGNRLLLTVTFGHFATDFYASFMPLVWPLVMVPLGLNYGMVGLASAVYTAASSLSQPIFGYIGDRFGSRFWAALGLACAATFMGLLGFIGSYPTLLLVVTAIGLGVAAFHPQGAMNAAIVAGARKATGMSLFSIGGTAAFALGPLLAGWLFTTPLGLKSTALLTLPGLFAAWWLYNIMLAVEQHKEATATLRTTASNVAVNMLGLMALIAVVALRSWTFSATTTYMPLLYKSWDLPLPFSGQVLFWLQAAGAIGTFAGGIMADRLGRRRVTFASLALLAPAAYLLYHSPVSVAPLAAALFGFVGEASLPVTLVMGQELLPRHIGLASGLIMGLAFVTGGVGVSLTGLLADRWGLLPALSLLPVLPVTASVLCLVLPKVSR